MTTQTLIEPRDRLIAAGARLMSERGYTATGVNDICQAAGIKRGSFFHYYPTKRDLALAVLDHFWVLTEERLLRPAFADDVPPLERIRRAFRMCFESQRSQKEDAGCMSGCPFGLLASEMSCQDEVIRARVESIFTDMAGYFSDALRELATTENIRLDADSAGVALVAYLEGALLVAKTNNSPALFARLAELAVPLPVLG